MELEAEGTAHALADMSQDPDHDGKRRLLLRKRINALDRAVELRIKSTSSWIDSGKEPDRGHALRVLDLINQRDHCKQAEERLHRSETAHSQAQVSPPGDCINLLSFCLIYLLKASAEFEERNAAFTQLLQMFPRPLDGKRGRFRDLFSLFQGGDTPTYQRARDILGVMVPVRSLI